MALQNVFDLVEEELGTAMQLIQASVPRDGYLYQVCAPLVEKPGKGIRPGLFLLSTQLIPHDRSISTFIPVATALEMVHWASLLHDDVIDEARTRRGIPTVNSLYNPTTAILVGDFFFSRALHFLAGYGDVVIETVAQLILDLVSGQMAEQMERGQYRLTEANYLQLIGQKTAKFLAVACGLGTRLAGASESVVADAENYGYCLGMVYQLRDDLLDIIGDRTVLGKDTGTDMAMEIETLPAIRARSLLPQQYHQVITEGSHAPLRKLLWECGALEYTEDLGSYYAERAKASLEQLPPGGAKDRLLSLLSYVVSRER